MNYLLRNGRIASSDEVRDIYIKDGKIERIEKSIDGDMTGVKVIDLENRLVLDGFADAHMHLDKALINERVGNKSGTLDEAIEIMGNYKANMGIDDIKERADQVLEKAYRNGTRYARTHVDVDDKIKLNSLKALMEIKDEWKDRIQMQIVAFPQEGIVDNKEAFHYLEEAMKMGADVIGGIPAREEDPVEHIKMIFDLALKYDVDVDMHIDETDDPDSLTIEDLCDITISNDYMGRVAAGHLCSLAANDKDRLEKVLDGIREAKINIISLPSTNLYLQGRGDTKNIRRGIAPIKRIYQREIPLAIASDNVRDPFNPFGNASLLELALIAAHGCHMGGQDDLETLFEMISENPRGILGFDANLQVGNKPSFIVLDATSKVDAIVSQSAVYGYFDEEGFVEY